MKSVIFLHDPQGVGIFGGDTETGRQVVVEGHLDLAAALLVPLDQVLLHLERVIAVHAALDDQRRRQIDRLAAFED